MNAKTGSRSHSLWQRLGPGLVTGAADDDPSGIATHSQIGAQFGFGLSWTFLFSFPLMVVIQEIAAKIGCVTGRGIAHNLRRHYSPWLLRGVVALLLIATSSTSEPILARWGLHSIC
jgi:NRAMP (natural resistance-associated macrophage protein)-like metal ion transporter